MVRSLSILRYLGRQATLLRNVALRNKYFESRATKRTSSNTGLTHYPNPVKMASTRRKPNSFIGLASDGIPNLVNTFPFQFHLVFWCLFREQGHVGFRVAKYARAVRRVVRQYPSSPIRYLKKRIRKTFQESYLFHTTSFEYYLRKTIEVDVRNRSSVSFSRLGLLLSHCLLFSVYTFTDNYLLLIFSGGKT